MGKTAIATPSSGIAATLLPGGKTAHSAFRIPFDLNSSETPSCSITRNCKYGTSIRECELFIWDECTMANKKAIEAVHRSLVDIRQPDKTLGSADIMGGAMFLFSGDFLQTLPIVERESSSCMFKEIRFMAENKKSSLNYQQEGSYQQQ